MLPWLHAQTHTDRDRQTELQEKQQKSIQKALSDKDSNIFLHKI